MHESDVFGRARIAGGWALSFITWMNEGAQWPCRAVYGPNSPCAGAPLRGGRHAGAGGAGAAGGGLAAGGAGVGACVGVGTGAGGLLRAGARRTARGFLARARVDPRRFRFIRLRRFARRRLGFERGFRTAGSASAGGGVAAGSGAGGC